jgi:hypothetical protein
MSMPVITSQYCIPKFDCVIFHPHCASMVSDGVVIAGAGIRDETLKPRRPSDVDATVVNFS